MLNKKYLFYFLLISIFAFILIFSCNTKKTEAGDLEPPVKALKSAPFSKGVNFSGWFESYSPQSIPFTNYTEQDFIDAKSLGVDVIRLPVRFHSMTRGEPDFLLDPLLLRFLNVAVDWAEKHELYIIIDNHSFDPVIPTSPSVERILISVWRQIAQLYKNRSGFVIYEILNEPHGISDTLWGQIQGRVIEEIRKIDKDRLIIAGGTDYNSLGKLSAIPDYRDEKIIYTFHFYDPYLFTHQGASWGSPPTLVNLRGLPFPAKGRRMPRIPVDLLGTWIESNLMNRYQHDASYAALSRTLDRAAAFSIERNAPVFCGEFGVYMINSNNDDRVRWYEFVSKALDDRNISRTSWDYYGGFGIFNFGRGRFNHDLNVDVARALKFTPPEQTPLVIEPVSAGFIIYDDFPNPGQVSTGYWGDKVDFSLYDTNAFEGDFAVRWGNTDQYNMFYFYFDKTKRDLTNLLRNGYFLEFKAKTNSPVSFDVRFVNEESGASIPWRMRYTIDEKLLIPDGRWHTIRIRLSDMSEHGAWINQTRQWINPRGDFSWKDAYLLEFNAEHAGFSHTVWFDNIKITR